MPKNKISPTSPTQTFRKMKIQSKAFSETPSRTVRTCRLPSLTIYTEKSKSPVRKVGPKMWSERSLPKLPKLVRIVRQLNPKTLSESSIRTVRKYSPKIWSEKLVRKLRPKTRSEKSKQLLQQVESEASPNSSNMKSEKSESSVRKVGPKS
jgi:hypothetical protein